MEDDLLTSVQLFIPWLQFSGAAWRTESIEHSLAVREGMLATARVNRRRVTALDGV